MVPRAPSDPAADADRRVASDRRRAVQNRGTIGNIASTSPPATLPVLAPPIPWWSRGARGERRVRYASSAGLRASVLAANELIVAVEIPRIRGRRGSKVGTRAAQSISKVMMAAVDGDAAQARKRRASRSAASRRWLSGCPDRSRTGAWRDRRRSGSCSTDRADRRCALTAEYAAASQFAERFLVQPPSGRMAIYPRTFPS